MTYYYPGIGGKPIILVCVKDLLSDNAWGGIQMLIDTGADSTCFPASFAKCFGHDNDHQNVEILPDAVHGIGGSSDAYLHSVQISLIHPSKSTREKTVIAWTSPLKKVQFIKKMECKHGLIGMDIIQQWKELRLEPVNRRSGNGVSIRITI